MRCQHPMQETGNIELNSGLGSGDVGDKSASPNISAARAGDRAMDLTCASWMQSIVLAGFVLVAAGHIRRGVPVAF
jgi:hypothetical protein